LSALVLPGFSAFTGEDAKKAASLLWNDGAVRVKRPSGIGGIGQIVVENREQLEAALADIGDEVLLRP
jgi:biotin carboxylase